MASESIAHEVFDLMGYLLRAHLDSRNNNVLILDRVFIHKLNSLSYFVQYNQATPQKSITQWLFRSSHLRILTHTLKELILFYQNNHVQYSKQLPKKVLLKRFHSISTTGTSLNQQLTNLYSGYERVNFWSCIFRLSSKWSLAGAGKSRCKEGKLIFDIVARKTLIT